MRAARSLPVLLAFLAPAVDLRATNLRLVASKHLALLGLALSAVNLVGEAGYQLGKDAKLTTDFEDFDDTKGKFFAGLGLQLSF